jgi:2-polyprenyl-3-methyl-5-hydroxy-6-metoxy-1,4-benzoquinol methylase
MREKVGPALRYWTPDPCKQFLRSVIARARSPRNHCADLPYSQTLREFEETAKILKRENIYGSGPPSALISEEVLRYVRQYAGKQVLDIGCGIGPYMKSLSSVGYECEGIEINPDYVAQCRKNGLQVHRMDAQAIQFPPNSFDTAMMIEVLEHLSDPIVAIREAFRIARTNVIISVPNIDVLPVLSKYEVVPWHILEATHVNFFTPKILRTVLNGFSSRTEVFTYGHFASWVTEQPMHMHIFGIGWKDPVSRKFED